MVAFALTRSNPDVDRSEVIEVALISRPAATQDLLLKTRIDSIAIHGDLRIKQIVSG